METARPPFLKYLFVCENSRDEGKCCAPDGVRLREALKKAVKDKGLGAQIRVSRSGCLDTCADGPNVLLLPDNVWFKHVGDADLAAIIARASEGV